MRLRPRGAGRAMRLAAVLLGLLRVACVPRLAPPGPNAAAPATPALDTGSFVAADGLRLPIRTWLPPPGSEVIAAIIGVHGFNDYSNAFALPGPWLAERGVALYAYDQRGFGAAPHTGFWPGRCMSWARAWAAR
jgi:alpha-beta hydrolase superfamily lysophospholipase